MTGSHSLAEDFLCEIIPADESAFIGCMIIAVLVGDDHIHHEAGKVIRIGRCPDLVADNADGIMAFSDIQHGLDKILPVLAKYPGNPDDKEFLYVVVYRKLTVQLCLTVDVQWLVILAVRLPGSGSLTIEHVIGREIHHFDAQFFADFCNIFGTNHIDEADFFPFVLVLSGIHGGPCSAVYNCIRLAVCKDFFHRSGIGDIHAHIRHGGYRRAVPDSGIFRGKVGADAFVAAFMKLIHHIMSKLSCHTCHKQFHSFSPP